MRTNIYQLKRVARQGLFLGVAGALMLAVFLPSVSVFADNLNPLTDRSLLLSSSAAGYVNTDGSGNPTYAGPGTGPNGQKTGETFSFKVSSEYADEELKGISFQYCTTAAGNCFAPGNNDGDYDPNDDGTFTDSTRDSNEDAHPNKKSDLEIVGDFDEGDEPGEFEVYINGVAQTGWEFSTTNAEDHTVAGAKTTGKMNYINLTNEDGAGPITSGTEVRIVFRASDANYITNPGAGAFFVKINTYDTANEALFTSIVPSFAAGSDTANPNVIDGGVTVANVMTDSIHITTKVLETMSFSVGVQNPDTQPVGHGTCDVITKINENRLSLGNPNAEFSLETGRAWVTNSYWRLSSNSSGGATVYYSGETLSNTVGDQITPIGVTKKLSHPGTEQFGLAIVEPSDDVLDPDFEDLVLSDPANYKNPTTAPFNLATDPASTNYNEGAGQYGDDDWVSDDPEDPQHPITAKFAFDPNANSVPRAIASQNTDVINCATAKMRYVGNIAPDTPAGIYTTKINYLAAPQY